MTGTGELTAWATLKNASYIAAFVASVRYIGFNPEALAIYTLLMLVDVATGVVRTYVISGGQAITSDALKFGVLKKVLALIALFTIGIAAQGVGFDLHKFVHGIVVVFILGEAYSILGNIHSARTGSKKVEFDAVEYALGRVGALLVRATGGPKQQ